MLTNKESAAPCVRNCCLDEDDICLGCGRSLSEILAWGSASEAVKKQILERSKQRKTGLNDRMYKIHR